MAEKCALAIDIGGTKINAGLVSAKGKILKEVHIPTEATKSAKRVVGNIAHAAELVAGSKLQGIGIGCPGPLDISRGTLHNPHRFPKMDRFNIKHALEKKLGMKVELDNDANCFVLGELAFGAARNCDNVLALTLGTGLGCGLVLNGRLYRGATGMAAEIGISPYRGGVLEDVLSGNGLVGIYRKIGGNKFRTAKEIGTNASGDALCKRAFALFGKEIAEGIIPFIDLLDPELVLFGGSIANDFAYFKGSLEKEVRKRIHYLPAKKLRIAKSSLGNRAGLLGAAVLAMPHYRGLWK